MINGEENFGITVHYVDEGIDTGDIILQKMFPIGSNEGYGDLLEIAFAQCPTILCEALQHIAAGNAKPIKQSTIHSHGTYFCQRQVGDERLDWKQSSQQIHNFIRAISIPGPCARSFIGEKEIAIIASETIIEAPRYIATMGEVVGRDKRGVIIKTADTTLRLLEVADVIDGVLKNTRTPTFRIGTRFTLA